MVPCGMARTDPSPSPSSPAATGDEAALVERARHDRTAFGELYRTHVAAVYAYAYRLTGSRQLAEDITSATFERALRFLPTYRWQPGGIRPWLLRIAANEANDWFRRQARQQRPASRWAMQVLSEAGADPSAEEALGLDGPAGREALRRALAALPAPAREVIGLRYLAGLDAEQAAAALGCSRAALAVRLHRALGALRRAVTELETEDRA